MTPLLKLPQKHNLDDPSFQFVSCDPGNISVKVKELLFSKVKSHVSKKVHARSAKPRSNGDGSVPYRERRAEPKRNLSPSIPTAAQVLPPRMLCERAINHHNVPVEGNAVSDTLHTNSQSLATNSRCLQRHDLLGTTSLHHYYGITQPAFMSTVFDRPLYDMSGLANDFTKIGSTIGMAFSKSHNTLVDIAMVLRGDKRTIPETSRDSVSALGPLENLTFLVPSGSLTYSYLVLSDMTMRVISNFDPT